MRHHTPIPFRRILSPTGELRIELCSASRMSAGASADAVQAQLMQSLAADREVARRVEATAALSLLRERFILAGTLGDQGYLPKDVATSLRELAMYPHRLQSLLDDENERRRLCKELPARIPSGPRVMHEGLQPLLNALKQYSPKAPSAALGMAREKAIRVYARRAVALLCDLWLDRALHPVRRVLDRRTGVEAEGGNAAEYEAGRLYRLSTRGEPVLKQQVVAHVGHLFADVKDFMRRTSLVGQAAMGDLLRREFYIPVIAAARRHSSAISIVPDKGGISVNNLLGDAISLSGTITGLLAIAEKINESARGTARNAGARASADAALAAERTRRGDPNLQHPWSVFVGAPLTLTVPAWFRVNTPGKAVTVS